MLPDPLELVVPVGTGAFPNYKDPTPSFTKIKFDSSGSTFLNSAAGASTPNKLVISHQQVGKGANMRDRHYLRLETLSEETEVIGGKAPAVLYLVADIPRNYIGLAEGVPAVTRNLWAMLIGILTDKSATDTALLTEAAAQVFWDRWMLGES